MYKSGFAIFYKHRLHNILMSRIDLFKGRVFHTIVKIRFVNGELDFVNGKIKFVLG